MSRWLVLPLTLCCLCIPRSAGAANAPSEGARGMCGAMGTIEYEPTDWMPGETTWWLDTDGVDPGTAGCHLGLTARDGKLNGRLFGEACRDDGLLVESNPAAGERHSHDGDVGHPDTFDCRMWCEGRGFANGTCEVAPAYPCEQSARCACTRSVSQ